MLIIIIFIQDVGLPYMLGRRHPEDTLFCVAEGDCVFYAEDCVEDWLSVVQDEARPWLDGTTIEEISAPSEGNEPSPSPAKSDDESPSPPTKKPKQEADKRTFKGWKVAQRASGKKTRGGGVARAGRHGADL